MQTQTRQPNLTEDEMLLIRMALRDRKYSCERHVTINQEFKSKSIHKDDLEIDESIQFWQQRVDEAQDLLDKL